RLPVEQRATRLAELLTSLGYMAEARPVAGALPVLTEHNCAIRLIAERFPAVCAAEEQFIADVLGATVTRQAHIAKGANCCEYCIGEAGPSAEARRPDTEDQAPIEMGRNSQGSLQRSVSTLDAPRSLLE